jgi:hypothetical protein
MEQALKSNRLVVIVQNALHGVGGRANDHAADGGPGRNSSARGCHHSLKERPQLLLLCMCGSFQAASICNKRSCKQHVVIQNARHGVGRGW